jgi:FixJ family two-component response regulator
MAFIIGDDASVPDGVEDLLRSIGLGGAVIPVDRGIPSEQGADAPGCIVLDVRFAGNAWKSWRQSRVGEGKWNAGRQVPDQARVQAGVA